MIERAIEEATKLGKKVVFEPTVGMVFNSEQEAYEFYNAYSWEILFGIRRGNKYVNDQNYESKQDILYCCEVSTNFEFLLIRSTKYISLLSHVHLSSLCRARKPMCYLLNLRDLRGGQKQND